MFALREDRESYESLPTNSTPCSLFIELRRFLRLFPHESSVVKPCFPRSAGHRCSFL